MTITEAAATVGLSRRYSYKWGSGRLTVSLAVISLVARSCGYYRGANRAPRCALIRGARGDPERARETSTTLPSATRAARRVHAVVPWQASTAAPEAWHRSGTTPR